MDENLEEGYERLRKVNAIVLSYAFSRSLRQLEVAVALVGDDDDDDSQVKKSGGGCFGFKRVMKKVWARCMKGKNRLGGSAEKLSAELLWLAEKLAASGSADEAVRHWASASKLGYEGLSAQLRLQGSLVKLPDCCDGSDEYDGKTKCKNTCWEAGKVARDKLIEKIATFQEGVSIRKLEVEQKKNSAAKYKAELLKLKDEEKILKGIVQQLKEHKEQIEKAMEKERIQKEKEEQQKKEAEESESKAHKGEEKVDVTEQEPVKSNDDKAASHDYSPSGQHALKEEEASEVAHGSDTNTRLGIIRKGGGGNWWNGKVVSISDKSVDFPGSQWERFIVMYEGDNVDTSRHSPWELHDEDTQWEQLGIENDVRKRMLSLLSKLEQSARGNQDKFGIMKLKQISDRLKFISRFPVPLTLEIIELRIKNFYYRSVEAMKHDISVMLSNAGTYFAKDAEMSAKMTCLSDWFERKLAQFFWRLYALNIDFG